MDGDNNVISQRLKQIKQENGLTLDEMGEIMGVSGASVSRYISGKVDADSIPFSRYKVVGGLGVLLGEWPPFPI